MSINRTHYFSYISERLATLSNLTQATGKLNTLLFHTNAEYFYLHFFNKMFGWNLENLNKISQNAESIDLISHSPIKIVIQVSATCTKEKINAALSGEKLKDYRDYHFKFISLTIDAKKLRKIKYNNPHKLSFDPTTDIYDELSILQHIQAMSIPEMKDIYLFIKEELGQEVDMKKLDSNLATIVNILAGEDLYNDDGQITKNEFEIERKVSFNKLITSKVVIDDYKRYHPRLQKIYSDFDQSGVNKSGPILAIIRSQYRKNLNIENNDVLFETIIEKVREKVMESKNFVEIPSDLLEVCINILVVDAFIRCKIFENPNHHAITK